VNTSSVLFLGKDSGTAKHRALALGALYRGVEVLDPMTFLPRNRIIDAWSWHTGGLFLEGLVKQHLFERIKRRDYDLVWVDGGGLVGPSMVLELKNRFGKIVNYNIDDPYGSRDGLRWRLYLKSVPFYDLVVVVRDCNVPEAIREGARKVLRVHMSADERAHSPRQITREEHKRWASEVAFVGTWMPERGPFIAKLIALGVPLSIYGDRWHKAPEWPLIRRYWRKPGLYNDDDYAKAIQCAKVNLGLLSKGNRDLTTTRSYEIPFLGGVLCAERTCEHTALYEEDTEAVFWNSPEECALQCFRLLNDETYRNRIAKRGNSRCILNRTTNQKILPTILQSIAGSHD